VPSRDQDVALKIEGLLSRVAEMRRSPKYLVRLLQLAGAPVHPSGWAIITMLTREGEQRVSDLAALLDIDQSTVSRQLKPLYEAGLVSRIADPADRRSAIVAITDAGQSLYESVRRRWLDDLMWFMRDWSSADRSLLGKLADRFSEEIDRGRAELQRLEELRTGAV
jgi:DNA-binding MarR family transcriptional regulator